MERLLCIVGGMNAGGAETYLMKLFRQLDKTCYQMDFCVAIQEEGDYDKEILGLGGKIYHVPPKTNNPFKSFNTIRKIVQNGKYKSVLRISQNSLSCLELYAAKMGGAKKLCFRSSNSKADGSIFETIVHVIFKPWLNLIANVKLAPSTEAAVFMFGKRQVKKQKVCFLHNAIDVEKFSYSEKIRKEYRKKLGIEGKYVIGHVGRFTYQKNHDYLVEIFAKVYKKNRNVVLILIGRGELKEEIKEKVISLHLESNVIFLDVRRDISELMNAMDLLLLPSLYEGMPNVLIEAQVSGLHCITSDKVTNEANITGLVKYISLDEPEMWIDSIVDSIEKEKTGRQSMQEQYKSQGYDIQSACRVFKKLVFIN